MVQTKQRRRAPRAASRARSAAQDRRGRPQRGPVAVPPLQGEGGDMTWTKFDDIFPLHRKIERLSDAAYRLHTCAIFWCNRNGTDGFIPEDELELVTGRVADPARVAAEELERGLWHKAVAVTRYGSVEAWEIECEHDACRNATGPGWVIHDFLDYQPSKAKQRAEKEANAERQRRFRARQAGKTQGSTGRDGGRNAERNPSGNASGNGARNGVRNGVTNSGTNGAPSRPVLESSTNSLFTADAVEQETEQSSPPPAPGRRKAETDAPQDFAVSGAMRAWARKTTPSLVADLERHTANFLDYHGAKGNRFRDWTRAWYTWMRKAADIAAERGTHRGSNAPRLLPADAKCDEHRRPLPCSLCRTETIGRHDAA